MPNSHDAQGRTISGEAIYQYIYALPWGVLVEKGIMLQSTRAKRRPRTAGRESFARLHTGQPPVASTS